MNDVTNLRSAIEENTILLLDINIPQMTGWQFLEWFDNAPADIKNSITIYMVSSSIDPGDIERANTNPYIKEFLIKPLKVTQLSLQPAHNAICVILDIFKSAGGHNDFVRTPSEVTAGALCCISVRLYQASRT